jgi:type IV pilus assembly protein PilW
MRQPFLSARRQRGLTLIELMVSLVIGLAVIGALLAAYMVSFRSSAHNDAMVQITEDATMALNIIRSQASMAGYSNVTDVDMAGQRLIGRGFEKTPVFGCNGSNFASYHGIVNAAACTGTSTSDTLEVAYEANDSAWGAGSANAILDGTGKPVDCLGNALDKTALGFYLADSKFYVSGNKLYCEGPGTAGAAPLVDNIEKLSIKYGLSGSSGGASPTQIAMYSSAPGAAPNVDPWTRVMSISICVVVRSAVPVIDKPVGTAKNALASYVDCAGNTAFSADGYLRRSFSTTVLLQNRIL